VRPLLRLRPSEDSNICTFGPTRTDTSRYVRAEPRSKPSSGESIVLAAREAVVT
jgi:hypothetical protein